MEKEQLSDPAVDAAPEAPAPEIPSAEVEEETAEVVRIAFLCRAGQFLDTVRS